MRPPLPRLYAVTDERTCPGPELVETVRRVLDAGVRLLQVRFKTTPRDEQVRLGRVLRELTREAGALLIANDSPGLALAIEADGVHLGAEDATVEQARALLPAGAIVGVSGDADEARIRGIDPARVDYLGLSSPWPSGTKEKAVPDPETFRALVRAAPVPVYAIGSVTPDRTPEMIAAGCRGVAAVGALFGAPDPAAAVRAFLRALPPGP